mgnify:CR=1 FL=1
MHNSLENLIRRLGRLPGLGPRSARRAVLFLLKNRDRLMLPLAEELHNVASNVRACVECGNLDITDHCSICADNRRDRSRICVVEDVGDLWAMERASVYRGLYHVLGGTLSALDGRGPEDLHIDRLVRRAGHAILSKLFWRYQQQLMGKPRRIISAKNWQICRLISPDWRMACRLVASWIILMMARWHRR